MTSLEPYALRVERLTTPLGLDEERPRFAWRLRSSADGARQRAYRLVVSAGGQTWDTGKVDSADQLEIAYAGHPLQPYTRYTWTLQVWDDEDRPSEPVQSWFETGRLDRPWVARWIGRDGRDRSAFLAPVDDDLTWNSRPLAAPALLRTTFTPRREVVSARLHITARGLYAARVNGRPVGDSTLNPGWTDYRRRIHYQTHDVTAAVRSGENVLGVVLADGWWSGFVGYDPRNAGRLYGDEPALLAELHLVSADGATEVIRTDDTWRESAGEWIYADLLMGEGVDARKRPDGWDAAGFDDSTWRRARVLGDDTATVTGSVSPPVRTVAELAPRSIDREPGSDAYLVDFGQNLVGHVRLRLHQPAAGQLIELTHGETVDEQGRLYTENLRRAEARDLYYPAGAETEFFEPQFTFHGFRYVRISGLAEAPAAEDVTAVAVSSDLEETGSFDCDNPDVLQIIANTRWSQRGNFLSVPTDCPQRDERLGWLADAQVFLPTSARLCDVSAFFANWMVDVVGGQSSDGAFGDIAPAGPWMGEGAPAWGDAGVIIPMALFDLYGDRRQLQHSFGAMVRWVEHIRRANPDLIWRRRVGSNYGDWLHVGPETDRAVLATAYFANSASLVARAAAILGRDAEAAEYTELATQIRAAFNAEFVDGTTITSDTQTCYLLALDYDLLPSEAVPAAVERLVQLVREAGNRLTTGFVGVSKICRVLSAYGHDDLAHALLVQEAYPSWLFPIRHGATTIWERWDGWTPEGGFQSVTMNSFNHYSLGAVVDWIYACLGGIDQAPGSTAYRELLIRPRPGAGLTRATASLETPLGRVATSWQLTGESFELDVEVPPGSTAVLSLPTTDLESVAGLSGELERGADGAVQVRVGSGRHQVSAAYRPAAALVG
ncbi:MAG TPA: glycoside hydrolase family 78 protein [Candidatus Ruania gallistercoris]|uniref:alpha-L-rhamnosidase n=1 Tax=Candidatus Ruania gallistercoris TaxID=2838746 RepID=A0A9D2J6K4_9MICO|nr:glycoside hydrolase family 78 protein [Candidatus Ruania gallistercoris]